MLKMASQKHKDYWERRANEQLRWVDEHDIDIFDELDRIYKQEGNALKKEIFEFFDRFGTDNQISYREAQQILRREDLSDYQENARRYFESAKKNPELLDRLNQQYRSARVKRMELLELDLEYRAGVINGQINELFTVYLSQVARHIYRNAIGGYTSSSLSEHTVKQLIQTPFDSYNYSQQLWGNTDNLVKAVKEVFKKGFIRGESPRTMAQELGKQFGVAAKRAQTLIRTDGTMIINNATAQRYIDAGLKHYRILVHLDDRTTVICRRIHKENKSYLLSEYKPGVNAPPFHYNCRSTIVPDDEELNAVPVAVS